MNINRLGIYVIYDGEGIIDNYVLDALKIVKKELTDLVVVCNGIYKKEQLAKLTEFTENIYVRENIGFDAGAFKDAITNYVGREKLNQYQEILLCNDSFFCLKDSFSNIFAEMDDKNVDFWSMTKGTGNQNIYPCIQSYFLVIRKKMLHSNEFYSYWESMPYYDEFMEVVNKFEKKFAYFFEKYGYHWDSYIDMSKYQSKEKSKYAFSAYHSVQYEIMTEQKYPIIKRKLFSLDTESSDFGLDRETKENFLLALEKISRDPTINMADIWSNILRVYCLHDIQKNCGLNYIFSNEEKIGKKEKIILFIYIEDKNDYKLGRLGDLDPSIDIYVLCKEKLEVLDKLNCKSIEIVEEIGDLTAYILGKYQHIIKEYNIFGVLRQYDTTPQEDKLYTVESSHNWSDCENLIGEKGYITQIINAFEREKNLGLLVTPSQIHSSYINNYIEDWQEIVSNSEEVRSILEIENVLQKQKKPAYWSNSFWCRVQAIPASIWNKLKDTVQDSNDIYKDNIMSKLLPYILAKRGYYTARVETIRYAKMKETIQEIYISDMLKIYKEEFDFHDYYELKKTIHIKTLNQDRIYSFLNSHRDIYIFGAGEMAELVWKIVRHDRICGFIVSDDKRKKDRLLNREIKHLSEISFKDGDGVILALNKRNTKEVIQNMISLLGRNNVLDIEY